MYCLVILEVGSLRSWCRQRWLLLRAGREGLPRAPSPDSGGSLAVSGVSLLLPSHDALPVCVAVSQISLFIGISFILN